MKKKSKANLDKLRDTPDTEINHSDIPHIPNEETIKALEEISQGKGLKSFDSVEALMKDLNSDD